MGQRQASEPPTADSRYALDMRSITLSVNLVSDRVQPMRALVRLREEN